MMLTCAESGEITTGTVWFALRVRSRKKFSVSSRASSSMMVISKHCLRVEGSEVKATRGLLAPIICPKSEESVC